ncbi:DUF4351 domain-containing protein [Kovacikia minuta]|nr:DUF4351 domain-containing protein [Kovacikia minuta]
MQSRIQQLPSPKLEELADALLDFASVSDLLTWLQANA